MASNRLFYPALPLMLLLGLSISLLPVFSTGAYAGQKPVTAAVKAPEIMIFMHNGQDVKGTLMGFDAKGYTVKTLDGKISKVPTKLYQGMVLNTAAEKEIGEATARDPYLMVSMSKYSFDMRDRLNTKTQQLLDQSSPCQVSRYPLFHFKVLKSGKTDKILTLNHSDCPKLDAAMLQAIQTTRLDPLPKDYRFDFWPMNLRQSDAYTARDTAEKPKDQAPASLLGKL